jgi:hypothetical protein
MSYPLFLSVVLGAMAFTAVVTWLSSRGEDAHH